VRYDRFAIVKWTGAAKAVVRQGFKLMTDTPFLQRSFTIKASHLLWAGLGVLFLVYLMWEGYWLSRLGLMAVRWHTHIVFTGILAAFFLAPFWLAMSYALKHSCENRVLLLLSMWCAIIVMEAVLCVTGINSTYMERKGGYYQSHYSQAHVSPYWTAVPGSGRMLVSPKEFSYPRSYNALGHSGSDWVLEKDSGTVRIITLGDSFTEGDGAPADSSYPAQLERLLIERGIRAEVLNAGMCGSDPFFNLKDLEERLMAYQPDIVLQAVTDNDLLFDLIIRGGKERFLPDGSVAFSKAPWWEPFYAMSHVARIFFHAAGRNIDSPSSLYSKDILSEKVNIHLDEIATRLNRLSEDNGFRSVMFTFPIDSDFITPYEADHSAFKQRVSRFGNLSFVDLAPCYERWSVEHGSPGESLYWRNDGHHNPEGYGMMANCIANSVFSLETVP